MPRRNPWRVESNAVLACSKKSLNSSYSMRKRRLFYWVQYRMSMQIIGVLLEWFGTFSVFNSFCNRALHLLPGNGDHGST